MKFLERDEKFSLKVNFEGIEDTNKEWKNVIKRLNTRMAHECEISDCSSMDEEMTDVLKSNPYVMKMIVYAREAKRRTRMKKRMGALGIIKRANPGGS
jgi:Cys-tRNA synthase (O-phospho-L-seryl-tRNA:Cys-tRNA synthase)